MSIKFNPFSGGLQPSENQEIFSRAEKERIASLYYVPTDVITSNYTANDKDSVTTDTSSGGFTVTLPLEGSIKIVDIIGNSADTGFGANNLLVEPQTVGQTIMGEPTLNIDIGATELILTLYDDDWRIFNLITPGYTLPDWEAIATVNDLATAEQGALADTALQPADITNFETTAQLNLRDVANRSRTNHTGVQSASTIIDFQTSVNTNTNVAANTAVRHSPTTVLDSTTIDFTLTGQQITGIVKPDSITLTQLNSTINASLGKADTALQAAAIGVTLQAYDINTVIDPDYNTFTDAEKLKLAGIEDGATVGGAGGSPEWVDVLNKPAFGTAALTDSIDYATAAQGALADTAVQPGALTTELGSRDTNNRARANHTGTQLAATISDFSSAVTANTNVSANTAARHLPVTTTDSDQIDFTLTANQELFATVKPGSITTAELSTGVNTSLGRANNSIQLVDIGVLVPAFVSDDNPFSDADKAKLDGIPVDLSSFETGAQLDDRDADNRNRANHAGTQLAETISDLDFAIQYSPAVIANTNKQHPPLTVVDSPNIDLTLTGVQELFATVKIGSITANELSAAINTKLNSINTFESNAQLDARDVANRNRSNHTGTQLAATIIDFDSAVSNNTDIIANTIARHDAVTVLDSANIDFTLSDQQITAVIKAGSITNTELHPDVIASIASASGDFETTTQLNARDVANRNRANHTGTQAISTISGLQAALDGKIGTISPVFTGTPTAPTASLTTNTTQLATTAFVQSLINQRFTRQVITVSGTTLDCSLGNYFIKTISGNTTFSFTNPPVSGIAYAMTFELTHNSGIVTWPLSVRWPSNTAPVLSTGVTHVFVFVTDDGGVRWRGTAHADYPN